MMNDDTDLFSRQIPVCTFLLSECLQQSHSWPPSAVCRPLQSEPRLQRMKGLVSSRRQGKHMYWKHRNWSSSMSEIMRQSWKQSDFKPLLWGVGCFTSSLMQTGYWDIFLLTALTLEFLAKSKKLIRAMIVFLSAFMTTTSLISSHFTSKSQTIFKVSLKSIFDDTATLNQNSPTEF